MKKLIICSLLMLITCCSFISARAEIIDSGTFDNHNATWTLDDYGCLTISGTGAITYSSWTKDFRNSIKSVVINYGIEEILSAVFSGCTNLESVSIPDSVKRTGAAFSSCKSLKTINIPYGLTKIVEGTFKGCSSLEYIDIPGSVTVIESRAFEDCTSLKNITLPGNLESIGGSVFQNCDSLESITIPNSVTLIGYDAFAYCDKLKSVTLSNNIDRILEGTFRQCVSLESIIIPESVIKLSSCFPDCTSLQQIYLSDNIETISGGTFTRCKNLTNVYYSGTESRWNEIYIGAYNQPLLNANIHFNTPLPGVFNSGSTSAGAPIITGAQLEFGGGSYDALKDAVNIGSGSGTSVNITVQVNTNGLSTVHLYAAQDAGKMIELPINQSYAFKPGTEFAPGKAVYLYAVDRATGKSTSTKTALKIIGSGALPTGTGLNFKLGNSVGFTIPDGVPVFEGTEISWGFDFIPISVEYDRNDNNKINVVFGVEADLTDKDGNYFKDFDFAKYKKDFKKAMSKQNRSLKQLRNDFKISNSCKMDFFGGTLLGGGKGGTNGDVNVLGYAEMHIVDGVPRFTEGALAIDAELKYTYQGQLFIWVVPIYYEFGGGIGAGFEGKITNLDPESFTPDFEACLTAKVMAEIGGGIGIANVATVGAAGEASLNIKTALERNYDKIWGEGSANFNVKMFGKEVAKKELINKEFLIYETGNPNGLLGCLNEKSASAAQDTLFGGIDIDAVYDNESRSYIESPAEWTGGADASAADYSNRTVTKLADNIYPDAAPQICEVYGTKIIVTQWDDPNRADIDRSMLVYSFYDESSGVWSEPVPVDDDGTADFYPCFENGVLVWQNEMSVLSNSMTLRDIAELGEIYAAVWNGNGFDPPTRITDNEILDTQPCLCTEGLNTTVVWTSNSQCDIMGIQGENSILESELLSDGWTEPSEIKGGLNSIVSIDAGAAESDFDIAYVVDMDNNPDTINDREIFVISDYIESRMTDNNILDSNPVFAGDKILYYSDTNIVYSNADGSERRNVFNEPPPGLTDSFTASSNMYYDIALWWSAAENGATEIYFSTYGDYGWTGVSQLTNLGVISGNPNGILNSDGSMCTVFTGSTANSGVITKTDLYSAFLVPSYNLAIKETDIDAENNRIFVTVSNNGDLPADGFSVRVDYGDISSGNNIYLYLEPGQSETVVINYDPLWVSEILKTISLTLKLPEGLSDVDESDNHVSIKAVGADLSVENVATDDLNSCGITADISNMGRIDAKNVLIKLRGDSPGGKVIREKTINVSAGDTRRVSFTFDKSELRYTDATKQIYITAECGSDELNVGDNDNYTVITSPLGAPEFQTEILNYTNNSGMSVINSAAVNNTNTNVTCRIFSAVYSASGVLKACDYVDANIPARSDTGVDISVPCNIKSDDIIKTFIWQNEEPLSMPAYLKVN